MRQIDADALMDVFLGEEGAKALDHSQLRLIKVKQIIDSAPTIAAIPVEWLKKRRDIYLKSYYAGHECDLHTAAILNDLILDWGKEHKE